MGEFDSMMAKITIIPTAIKVNGEPTVHEGDIDKQALRARDCLVDVDYHKVRGTCGDERERIGLASGDPFVETRPSAFGGPDVYAMYIGIFSGILAKVKGIEQLRQSKGIINGARIPSGGHEDCKANEGLPEVIAFAAESANRESIQDYTKLELGEDYDRSIMDFIFSNVEEAATSDRYDDWDGTELKEVLGDEAGQAIERLVRKPHKAKTFIRQEIPGKTVDQTRLHHATGGEDSFEVDDPYLDLIEAALAEHSGDPEYMKKVARHAREVLHASIANAVPNEELHEIHINL